MSHPQPTIKGYWLPEDGRAIGRAVTLTDALEDTLSPLYIIADENGAPLPVSGGHIILGTMNIAEKNARPLLAYAPPLRPDGLGDAYFCSKFNLRYPYICGAMANGITSVEMVRAAGAAGMIGFFGSGGLAPEKIAAAIERIKSGPDKIPFGFNLIHSPNAPDSEARTVQLYLETGVNLVSASAYMDLTLPLVYYRTKGIHRDPDGTVVCPNQVIAKISRVEVARKFFAPPPEKFLQTLTAQGRITADEAELARTIPMADALTAEADSGGHTDNRPALALLPTILALRDEMTATHAYDRPIPVGLGGGIATPDAAAAAFSMGAAYILTGSINQACVEAGTSDTVRRMLAQAQQADVTMAPAADMFELGVKVQVLKRGTMFPQRAAKLYELYRAFGRYEDVPAVQRNQLERDFFRSTFQQEWQRTRHFFEQSDPAQIQKADTNPKHKMALVFRSYLGQSSHWANSGNPERKIDYQIWCGPAMGAFNEWVKGSFLEDTANRDVVTLALNLLYGACVQMRANWLRCQGIRMESAAGRIRPLTREQLTAKLTAV